MLLTLNYQNLVMLTAYLEALVKFMHGFIQHGCEIVKPVAKLIAVKVLSF